VRHVQSQLDIKPIHKLDNMRWFSHRRSRARKDRSRQNRPQATVRCTSPRYPWRPHNGLACCCMERTAYSARIALACIVNGDDSAFFRYFLSPVTLIFDLWPPNSNWGKKFCTMHLTAKFHRPTFNRSKVIGRTNRQTHRQTDKQTPLKTSTLLRYSGG